MPCLFARAGGRLMDIILPPRWLGYQAPKASRARLCAKCWQGLSLIERPFCERLGIPFVCDHGEGVASAQAVAYATPAARHAPLPAMRVSPSISCVG